MKKSKLCSKCGRKLNRGEKEVCLDCLLLKMGQMEIKPFNNPRNETNQIYKKIQKEIEGQAKENKQEE